MAQVPADRAAIIAALLAALATCDAPTLNVIEGKPWTVAQNLTTFVYFEGTTWRVENSDLTGRSYASTWKIQTLWLPPLSTQIATLHEGEVWDVESEIREAIDTHATFDGLIADSEFTRVQAGLWQHISGAVYESLELDLLMWSFDTTDYGA